MIYLAMLSMTIIAALVSFSMVSSQRILTNPDPSLVLTLRYILIAVTPLSLGIGYFIFKKYLASISSLTSLKEKLFRYQLAVIIRYSCLEAPAMLGVVAAFITGEQSFLLFTAIIIVMFLMLLPGTGAIVQDLGLSQHEKVILENPDAGIE
jgi:hypothetical protein